MFEKKIQLKEININEVELNESDFKKMAEQINLLYSYTFTINEEKNNNFMSEFRLALHKILDEARLGVYLPQNSILHIENHLKCKYKDFDIFRRYAITFKKNLQNLTNIFLKELKAKGLREGLNVKKYL